MTSDKMKPMTHTMRVLLTRATRECILLFQVYPLEDSPPVARAVREFHKEMYEKIVQGKLDYNAFSFLTLPAGSGIPTYPNTVLDYIHHGGRKRRYKALRTMLNAGTNPTLN